MKCGYIDVLQLHDPEYAPSLDQLFTETLPAMMECRKKGLCRALGLTGYPLEVQHLILQKSLETLGENIFDQSLTYGHFNLHDTSLVTGKLDGDDSFLDYCHKRRIQVLAAAPLSMGLLTHTGQPDWHPADDSLRRACREASDLCIMQGVNLSTVSLLFALSEPRIPCTILGMKNVLEVKVIQSLAIRIGAASNHQSQADVLKAVLSDKEHHVLELLRDPSTGPFAHLAEIAQWDTIAEAWYFWEQQGKTFDKWQKQVGN